MLHVALRSKVCTLFTDSAFSTVSMCSKVCSLVVLYCSSEQDRYSQANPQYYYYYYYSRERERERAIVQQLIEVSVFVECVAKPPVDMLRENGRMTLR